MKEARQRALLGQLREHQVASTAALSDALGASAATVRRDLDELSSLGLIVRVFGGARLASEDPLGEKVDDPFDEVLARNDAGKQAIARLVAQRITPGSTVFLESGTTTYHVATELQAAELTVVTNSLRIADLLTSASGVELIMLGGHINREYMSTQGTATTSELANLQIDVAVLGCSGVGRRAVVRDTDPRGREIKRAACKQASLVILVADPEKFPGIGAYNAIDIADVDLVVTDLPIPGSFPSLPAEVLHP